MTTLDADTFPARPRAASLREAPWIVLKFGGTSVSTAGNWAGIHDLLLERVAAGYRPLVVHSALAGVSNRIQDALGRVAREDVREQLAAIEAAHLALAAEMRVDGRALVGGLLLELEQLFAGMRLTGEVTPRLHARAMAMGELMSTTLGAAYLQARGLATTWLDARQVLQSVDVPGTSERTRYVNASCGFDADATLQERCREADGVVLTQGFIASNARGETVILGRGGSDTSGAYFAAKLGAAGLEIWTDVPGMFSANPRTVQGARLLRALSYAEAQEIASTGGSVLHPRCLAPVRHQGIPLRVKDTTQPGLPGTLVSRDAGSDAPRVKAISGRTRVTLVSMETLGMWQAVGFLASAFRCFADLGLSIDLVSTSESNVTVTLDPGANAIDAATLAALRAALEKLCRVKIIENVEVVSLVGQKIRSVLHQIGPAFDVFQELPIHLMSQAASDLNLSIVVEEGQSRRVIQALHELLVQPARQDAVFGPTWEELREAAPAPASLPEPWWARRRAELIGLAARHSSAYVYDLESVRAAIARLKAVPALGRVLFAMKANSNPAVLREVHAAGLGFECVSPGEIRRVLELFPDIDRGRILFTPNFAPREEYQFGLEQQVWLTLDNLYPLREWGGLFAGREVFLRIDTGHGHGHHEHVRTAGVHSKFGIPLFELAEARALAERAGARVVGLHAHTGSGILSHGNWQQVARLLAAAAQDFPQLRFLDLGGGLGVPEKRDGRRLDLAALGASLEEIRAAWPAYELWLEPGRYLIAEAGVLVTTVTQTKGKGEVQYVGVSTGMNSLIRPALYGAYHEIANLSRWGEPSAEVVNVVGPNCETGDRLGTDRLLPLCREGDVLAIANAGAYGHVMSSRYNLREPAVEIAI
ncbi:MAG: bifunctional aspartate kinase/diaminopimelate decarboxylase [Gammaproteobacteria bacterium]|nr:MAG: bifunctional aspartate kinase/diaminopimelate decarboxylase [Gammaproteobacteria bacterium]